MNKFIRYVTLSNSSKICCMAKGAKTFTTIDSHFVRPHENFSSCNLLITENVQSMDRKEWFIVWNASSPSAAICLHSSVIVFVGKIRRYFFTETFVFSSCVFSFLVRCSISKRPPCYIENCDLQMEHSTFPTC
jgi:hypothetical protein